MLFWQLHALPFFPHALASEVGLVYISPIMYSSDTSTSISLLNLVLQCANSPLIDLRIFRNSFRSATYNLFSSFSISIDNNKTLVSVHFLHSYINIRLTTVCGNECLWPCLVIWMPTFCEELLYTLTRFYYANTDVSVL